MGEDGEDGGPTQAPMAPGPSLPPFNIPRFREPNKTPDQSSNRRRKPRQPSSPATFPHRTRTLALTTRMRGNSSWSLTPYQHQDRHSSTFARNCKLNEFSNCFQIRRIESGEQSLGKLRSRRWKMETLSLSISTAPHRCSTLAISRPPPC